MIYLCECVCYLLSLPCDKVPNCLAKERCQEWVKWGRLLQEGIQSFQQRLLITQLIIDHSHITCQQLTGYIWIPVINKENTPSSKTKQKQNQFLFSAFVHLLKETGKKDNLFWSRIVLYSQAEYPTGKEVVLKFECIISGLDQEPFIYRSEPTQTLTFTTNGRYEIRCSAPTEKHLDRILHQHIQHQPLT